MRALALAIALVTAFGCTETYDYDPATAGEAEGGGHAPRTDEHSRTEGGDARATDGAPSLMDRDGARRFVLVRVERRWKVGVSDPLRERVHHVGDVIHAKNEVGPGVE